MKIGGRNVPDIIQLKHWLSLVPDTRAAQQLLTRELKDLAHKIVPEAEALVKESAQLGYKHAVLQDILKLVKSRARQVLSVLS